MVISTVRSTQGTHMEPTGAPHRVRRRLFLSQLTLNALPHIFGPPQLPAALPPTRHNGTIVFDELQAALRMPPVDASSPIEGATGRKNTGGAAAARHHGGGGRGGWQQKGTSAGAKGAERAHVARHRMGRTAREG